MRRLRAFTGFVLLFFALGTLLGACRPKHPFEWVSDVNEQRPPVESVPLRPGDTISVSVSQLQELSNAPPFTVNADGSVVLPIVGPFSVAGITAPVAAKQLNARLQGIVTNPDARIAVVTPRAPLVAVLGEVNEPGRYTMDHGEGVLQGLARAGGLTEFADPDEIYVVRSYPKRKRIRFRYSDLTGGVAAAVDFVLLDGDVIVVE